MIPAGEEIKIQWSKAENHWKVIDQRDNQVLAIFEKRLPAAVYRCQCQELIDADTDQLKELMAISNAIADELKKPDNTMTIDTLAKKFGVGEARILESIDWGIQYCKFTMDETDSGWTIKLWEEN